MIIAPGNGCTPIRESNWYAHLHANLVSRGIPCSLEDFPDPYEAKRSVWLPFLESLGADEHTVLVGHSSGAQAALRFAETHRLRGVVLVAATYSDLGDAGERASGYYPSPDGASNLYDFAAMKSHCSAWHQFHSNNDPFIPLREAEQIRDGLGLVDTYYMLPGRSHFFSPFPELLSVLLAMNTSNDHGNG